MNSSWKRHYYEHTCKTGIHEINSKLQSQINIIKTNGVGTGHYYKLELGEQKGKRIKLSHEIFSGNKEKGAVF